MGLIDNNSVSFRDPSFYKQKANVEKLLGRTISREEFIRDHYKVGGGYK